MNKKKIECKRKETFSTCTTSKSKISRYVIFDQMNSYSQQQKIKKENPYRADFVILMKLEASKSKNQKLLANPISDYSKDFRCKNISCHLFVFTCIEKVLFESFYLFHSFLVICMCTVCYHIR